MMWLWSVGPLVLVALAGVVTVATRRLDRERIGLGQDRGDSLLGSTAKLSMTTAELHSRMAALGAGDDAPSPPDR